MSYNFKTGTLITADVTDATVLLGAKLGQGQALPDPISALAVYDYVAGKLGVTAFALTLLAAATAADARTVLGAQASDAELSAIAGLTSAADKLPYFTGSGTAALADFTSFGRSLMDDANAAAALTTLGVSAFVQTFLDDADAATARATLGLAIGTNVQAYDAELAALAGLTSAADKLPYFTGSGTAAVADFTSVARTLVSQTTQALMRSTGLGSTTVGDAVFVAANAAAGRSALSAAALGANTFTDLQTITQASTNAGILASTGYSVTGSNATHMIDLAGTWNTTGAATGLKMNMTATSAANCLLFDFQVGGTSLFSLAPGPVLALSGGSSFPYIRINQGGSQRLQFGSFGNNAFVTLNNGGVVAWENAAGIAGANDLSLGRSAAGVLVVSGGGASATAYFTFDGPSVMQKFGGVTSSFVAWKRSGTDLQCRLADDSGYAGLQLGATSSALKVGTHSAIAAETVTGYITIKDSGGTDRKIAVVS